jgi:hypothetical protein
MRSFDSMKKNKNKSVKKKTLSKKEKEDLIYKKLERILEKVAKIPITKESKKVGIRKA